MRHSNHIMIREFVRLLREGAEVPQNPLEALVAAYKANPDTWDDGDGGGDIDDVKEYAALSGAEEAKAHSEDARFERGGKFYGMTADIFKLVLGLMGEAEPRPTPAGGQEDGAQTRKAPTMPKTPRAKTGPSGVSMGGKNFLRADDMADLFAEISKLGTEAMMASIIAQAEKTKPGMSSDDEMARRNALQRVNDDLVRVGQFSGLDLAGADQSDPSVAGLIDTKAEIIGRLVNYIPQTGLFKAGSYTDASEVETALNRAGIISAGASLEDLSVLSANALGDMVFRALAGTAKGRKAIRDINDPSFMADYGAELDAIASTLEGLDVKTSYAGKVLKVNAGKKNYDVTIPKAVALESLKDPTAIKTFLAGVAADLRDHQARFDVSKKPPVKPTAADFEKPEAAEPDPVAVVDDFVAEHADSNALSELKNQLGRWVQEKTGKDTVLRNEFDRKLKPQQIFDLVEDTLYKMAESPNLDTEERGKLADLAAGWTVPGQIPDGKKIEITMNILSMLGVVVEPDQVKIMAAVGDLDEELRAGGLEAAEAALEKVDPDLVAKLENDLDLAVTSDEVKDSLFDVFMGSEQMKGQLTGLDIDGLENEELLGVLQGMGVQNVYDALLALKERQFGGVAASKEDLKNRKKELRNAMIEIGKGMGIPSPSASVNDLANAVSSGPKLAGFIRSLNVFFDAGLTPENIERLVASPKFQMASQYMTGIEILKATKKAIEADPARKGAMKAELKAIPAAIQKLEAGIQKVNAQKGK